MKVNTVKKAKKFEIILTVMNKGYFLIKACQDFSLNKIFSLFFKHKASNGIQSTKNTFSNYIIKIPYCFQY